ncbi:MAG: hypothetical protein QGH47_03650, partial [Candidatus Woesearchaeota archaeon]|nr:hypothetical protein [Candidatus Woesearchaeota archaeon]
MDNLTSILEFIKIRGPIIPIQAAKEIGTNILMASAMLSELSAKGSVKVSSIKVGGTPLYYTPGQEIKLQSYLKYLNDKQKVAYEKLKQQKILLDTKLEPVMRQALRQIKDFAKPLEVTSNQETSLFWKWYLLPNDEATRIIKNKLGMKSTKKTPSTPKTTPSSPPKQKSQKTPLEKISQKKEIKKHSPPKTHPFQSPQDTFVEQMLKYFSKNNIRVVEHNLVRKNSESDFI